MLLLRALTILLALAIAAAAAQMWRLHTLQTAVAQDRAAQAETDRLRRALVATAQDRAATAAGCADDRSAADRLAGLLSACAGLVADGLRVGDAIATQVTGLQSAQQPSD